MYFLKDLIDENAILVINKSDLLNEDLNLEIGIIKGFNFCKK